MANSLITRCPKCSTAFRVSDEVLSMAKGKVRCGQCFHIFDAAKVADNKAILSKPTTDNKQPKNTTVAKEQAQVGSTPLPVEPKSTDKVVDTRLAPAEEIVNPDWLHTLFNDEDLNDFETFVILTALGFGVKSFQ